MAKKGRDDDRARKTIYLTGYNPKLTNKHHLKELFTQGGPVVDITMFDTHAYILFQDEISVPYCLALFNEVELHGEKLRLNPRSKTKDTYCFMNYLAKVRLRLKDDYAKVSPPKLPAKDYPEKQKQARSSSSSSKRSRSKPTSLSFSSTSMKKSKRGRRNKQTKICYRR